MTKCCPIDDLLLRADTAVAAPASNAGLIASLANEVRRLRSELDAERLRVYQLSCEVEGLKGEAERLRSVLTEAVDVDDIREQLRDDEMPADIRAFYERVVAAVEPETKGA